MTFKDYIAQRKASYDDMGDFMRLACADNAMPEADSWPELRAYLQTTKMPPHVIEAGEKVWTAYGATLKDPRRASERARA